MWECRTHSKVLQNKCEDSVKIAGKRGTPKTYADKDRWDHARNTVLSMLWMKMLRGVDNVGTHQSLLPVDVAHSIVAQYARAVMQQHTRTAANQKTCSAQSRRG